MVADKTLNTGASTKSERELLTIFIGGQQFGVPILQVQDVLGEQTVTRVPLAQAEVAGTLNLRGRIVTAINVRKCLGMPEITDKNIKQMSVVVEHNKELFSLIIDKVGDVLNPQEDKFDHNIATLDPLWREVSLGVYRLEGALLVVLDVPKLLDMINAQ